MHQVLVIEVHDSVVYSVHSFTGDREEISAKAEEKFLEINRESNWSWREEDAEVCLQDGYSQWGENSVAISWL